MTAADLPQDSSQWPDDPFELLGCDPEVDRKELKRAYTRRIRKFKPENHPEEFRRLRDAYEWADRVVERREEYRKWQSQDDDEPDAAELEEYQLPPSEPPDDDPPTERRRPIRTEDNADGDEDPSGETPADAAPRPQRVSRESREQLIESFWNDACNGEVATAYRRLAELLQSKPGDEELCARLYWLRRLAPEVEPGRVPAEWLCQGLSRGGLRGRLLELYTAHLDEEPAEALSRRCTQVLEAPAPIGSLYALVVARWRAAARENSLQTIPEDLFRLREKFLEEDHELWLRLIVTAMGYLAWEAPDQAQSPIHACRRELDEATDLHLKLADELDRCDLLMALAQARRGLATGMPPWPRRKGPARPDLRNDQLARTLAAMLPVLWNAPSLMRDWLSEWVAALVRNPQVGLAQLDVLQRNSPALLGYLLELLGHLGGPAEEPDEILHDALTRRVLSFFDFVETSSYASLRPGLASLCTAEFLPLERIVEVLIEHPSYSQFAQPLRTDSAMHTLVAAHRTFWN